MIIALGVSPEPSRLHIKRLQAKARIPNSPNRFVKRQPPRQRRHQISMARGTRPRKERDIIPTGGRALAVHLAILSTTKAHPGDGIGDPDKMNKVCTLEVDDKLPEKVERDGVLLADGFHGGEEEFYIGFDFGREVRRDGRVGGGGGGGGLLGLEDAD